MNLPFFLLETQAGNPASAALQIANDPLVLGAGIGLIIVAIILILLIKQIIINSILGIVALAVVYFVFHIELPWIAAIVVSIVFGLAGIGAMLLLKFFGVF